MRWLSLRRNFVPGGPLNAAWRAAGGAGRRDRMRALRYFLGVCLALALGVAIFIFAARPPAFAPIEPPAADSFAAAQVRRGAELAAIGNCDVCHTAPGGQAFAGGRG